ncbi:MAG: hypothetical protein GX326_06860, partial [Clostridiaceae bacterium]|nr:hypothetical protein [Clostridiaceae bacterium]
YFVIDYLNLPYGEMIRQHGLWLVIINVLLNLIMAGLASFMAVLSDHALNEKGIKTKGENMSFVSVLFGILTYGCTPCVISFFAVFGISFSVIALPFAGLPYKIISLLLILTGIWLLFRELKRKECKVKF